jgi:hypothetical protein
MGNGMNERTKELAAQCGYRSNPDVYDRNQSFDIEKFAELVRQDEHRTGMTLRDYFAAKALQACFVDDTNLHGTARLAYRIADAMLEAKGGEK